MSRKCNDAQVQTQLTRENVHLADEDDGSVLGRHEVNGTEIYGLGREAPKLRFPRGKIEKIRLAYIINP